MNVKEIFWHFMGGGGRSWYVRPSGGSYGNEDGTSYDNAWDGFANIDTAVINSGDVVYIAGTHNEFLTAAKIVNGVSYVSLIADPATLSGQDSRNICADCTSKSNVTFTDIIFSDAVVSCLNIDSSTGIITNNCTFSGSGNQGLQHLGTTTATHNNPTCSDCVDDGLSMHDDCVVILVGGTFNGNDQNINIVGNAQITITGSPTFTGTSTYDLYSTSASTPDSCAITMTGGTVRNINADVGGRINLTNVTVSGTTAISGSVGAGSVYATNTIFTGALTLSAGGTLSATNSRITAISATTAGAMILSKCIVRDEVTLISGASILAEYTFFEGVGTNNELVDVQLGASGGVKYCVFKHIAASQFGLAYRTGSTVTHAPNGNIFIGSSNVGRGIFSQIDITINNNIFYDLEIGAFRSAGTFVLNNACLFDCTTPKSGTITSNSEVTTDPVFADVANNDYNLGVGSSCLGTGVTLSASFDEAIDTAVWGDASTVPVVATAEQAVAWNIGAYV